MLRQPPASCPPRPVRDRTHDARAIVVLAGAVAVLLSVALGGCARAAAPDTARIAPIVVQPMRPMQDTRTQLAYFATSPRVPGAGWASPEAIAEAIRAFAPDVLLVDVPPALLDAVRGGARPNPGEPPWSLAPEVLTVLLPLADELGIAIEGVSAWTEEAHEARVAYDRAEPHGPPHRRYLLARARAMSALAEARATERPDWIADAALDEMLRDEALWLAYFAEERMGHGGVLWQMTRQAARVDDALDRWHGMRVALVLPVESRFYQLRAAEIRGGVEVVPVAPLFR